MGLQEQFMGHMNLGYFEMGLHGKLESMKNNDDLGNIF